MLSTETFLAVAIQCAATVHPSTSLDVARVESGLNPYAIAEIIPERERKPGRRYVIPHYPTSQASALRLVSQIAATGRRYSVGLMQITSTNFRRYGVSAAALFQPCTNLSVFERIMSDCYRRGGNLKRALSCYYTGNFESGQKPEAAFSQTSYIQRMGYVVPGTRQDSLAPAAPSSSDTALPPIQPRTVWPGSVVRGLPRSLRRTPPPGTTTGPTVSDRQVTPRPEEQK